tara:strand:+ start:4701 stop:4982 length:282 start_codon:yes stop_codon:yes gene_type:complete
MIWVQMLECYILKESKIQLKRIKQLEAKGYYVIKLKLTNKNGIPDIIAIPKGAKVLFSEIKTPGKKLSGLQKFRIKELEQYGFETEVYTGDDL